MSKPIRIWMLRALNRMNGVPLPQSALFNSVDLAIAPRPTDAEKRNELRFLESENLIAGLTDAVTEEVTWTLTDAGRHKAAAFN